MRKRGINDWDSVSERAMLARETREEDPPVYDCIDGGLTMREVARAGGVSSKEAMRAVAAYLKDNDGKLRPNGVVLSSDEFPDPSKTTRAVMARHVAAMIGVGRFGVKKRAAERAANREKQMSTMQHPWRNERHGRAVASQQGGAVVATLTCSKCPTTETIRFRQLCDARDMDRKFIQKGWAVDPSKCPDHNRHNHQPKKEKPVSTEAPTFAAPTPGAIAAQAKMFGLLQMHFDPETSVYGSGYSDAKIAEECRLSADLVVGVRREAFGELKVPAEVAQLTADIEALESLLDETIAPIKSELSALRTRVRECCKKFGG